jgi:sugar/nucleoside kinase (ribokinase family)
MTEAVDVLGLGNSLVDIIAQTGDAYLHAQEMVKGAMTLIDEDRAEALYAARVEPRIVSGGSAANTIVGVASFGVKSAYIGKVKNDDLGYAFIEDIRATGVAFDTRPAEDGPATGRCFVYVTPDGERTMNTYLGASTYLSTADVDEAVVRAARFVYLEGYMWDRPAAKSAFQKAAEIARQAGHRVSLTLSDSFCVDRFRGEFIDLMRRGLVDTLFSNTEEILSLYQTPHLTEALDAVRREGVLAIVTRSEKGSIVIDGRATREVPAYPVARVVDTTGAGDMFAAGFLAGLAKGSDLETCARLGALAAAEIIQHLGARPLVSLAQLARETIAAA